MSKLRNVLVCSGEVSGDRIIRPFLDYLIERGVHCRGLGGQSLVHAGLELVCKRDGLSVTGTTEALRGLAPTLRAYRQLVSELGSVDALLLCDYPEVNLRLAKKAQRLNVPVVYLAPPQAWAWRPWRSAALAHAHYVGCLFPFSTQWYRSRGVAARWLGHPLAEHRPLCGHRVDDIAILPGSRVQTVCRTLPSMLKVVRILHERGIGTGFNLVRSKEIPEALLTRYLDEFREFISITTDADSALSHSTVSLVHPGTATLHSALRGCMPVTMCDPTRLTRLLGRVLMNAEHLSLPNLILDRVEFPEFVMAPRLEYAIADSVMRALNAPDLHRDAFNSVRLACYNDAADREPEIAFRFLFS
ncbi:MAG: hypothetical protein ACPGQS_14575 [Bradymonadia bacterium]